MVDMVTWHPPAARGQRKIVAFQFVCVANRYATPFGSLTLGVAEAAPPQFHQQGITQMRQTIAALLLLAMAVPLSGCIVEGRPGGGWCYYHPYRCR
jgi:hypothetical protein